MAAISLILIVWKNFKLLTPAKVWVSSFLSVNGNGISGLAIIKKLKNGCHFINIDCLENFQIMDPSKFGSPVFRVLTDMEYQHRPLCVDRNGISASAIMKKLKNDWHFININRMEKCQITDPPKFGSLVC